MLLYYLYHVLSPTDEAIKMNEVSAHSAATGGFAEFLLKQGEHLIKTKKKLRIYYLAANGDQAMLEGVLVHHNSERDLLALKGTTGQYHLRRTSKVVGMHVG